MSGIFSGGGTPDEPRMTPTELEELLIHIIRVPAVYSEARRFFDDDAWDLYSERHYRILLDGFFKVADTQLYANGDIPYLAVHNEVHRVMADDPMLKDAQYMINDIIGRPSDADPHIGLLYHSYKGVDEDDLNVPYGLVLLKKFLHERQVIDKVRRVLDGAGGRNPTGFDAVLAKALETAAAIATIGQDVAGVAISDQDDEDDNTPLPHERILEALVAVPDGETAAALARAANIGVKLACIILDTLVDRKIVVEVRLTRPHGKNGQYSKTWDGYRLAALNGQSASPAQVAKIADELSREILDMLETYWLPRMTPSR
jgi:hypothetical protein